MDTDQIAVALARYQEAERAYYRDALFPFFGTGLLLGSNWREEIATLRSKLEETRVAYFEALGMIAPLPARSGFAEWSSPPPREHHGTVAEAVEDVLAPWDRRDHPTLVA